RVDRGARADHRRARAPGAGGRPHGDRQRRPRPVFHHPARAGRAGAGHPQCRQPGALRDRGPGDAGRHRQRRPARPDRLPLARAQGLQRAGAGDRARRPGAVRYRAGGGPVRRPGAGGARASGRRRWRAQVGSRAPARAATPRGSASGANAVRVRAPWLPGAATRRTRCGRPRPKVVISRRRTDACASPFDGDPMNKRNAFHVLAAAVLAAASTALAAPPPQALKDVYADAFLVGTAMNADMVSGKDARAQALVPLHFNAITAENAMKAEELHPEPGTWDFADADAFVEFGQRHGLFMVGHTLVWHNQTPAWFFQDDDGAPAGPAVMRERMRDYIHTVAGRYAGKVQAWDVVNEQIG